MSKTCNNCGTDKTPANVPYVVHESAMARAERQAKRLIAIIILLIILLVGSNIGWLVYESQFETVETNETIIEAEQDGSGINIVGGGDVDYGTESKNN
jgi:hypothetical protein